MSDYLIQRLRQQLVMVPAERPLILKKIKELEQKDLTKNQKFDNISKTKEIKNV